MATIQVDMFDVQLGAALLLQFQGKSGVVRVLADAGHRKYKVAGKLGKAMDNFAPGPRRLDLIIGTHYDADHLAGLVDVISDDELDIGEIWLPPVVNNVDANTKRVASADENLLALQLLRPDADKVLARYLRSKAQICLNASHARAQREAWLAGSVDAPMPDRKGRDFRELDVKWKAELDDIPEDFFLEQLSEAEVALGWRADGKALAPSDEDHSHADHVIVAPFSRPREVQDLVGWRVLAPGIPFEFRERVVDNLSIARLALIQGAAAKGAINAKALNEVAEAIKGRKPRPRVMSCTNTDGVPRPFGWDAEAARFAPNFNGQKDDPSLKLLGPSEGLVERYRELEPEGDYDRLAYKNIRIVDTTESNELSYVIRFAHKGQAILVAGDAACVDFGPESAPDQFHKALIDALGTLDVIQIAHHGGANGYFYNCLLASSFRTQKRKAYLLLSHETRKTKRPSGEFSRFVEESGRVPDMLPLVFTAQPLEIKVRNVLRYFHKPVGKVEDSGDARLEFDDDWVVTRHVVTAPAPTP